ALLEKAEGMFDDMAQYGRQTPELRYRKAWMLIQFARNYAILGDTGKQSARANEAHHLLSVLSAQKPDDTGYQRDLAIAYHEVGKVLVAQGNPTDALKAFLDSLAIMERLAKADPDKAQWQDDLTQSHLHVGDVRVSQGNLTDALKAFLDSLAIIERLAKADPNPNWQHDLSVSYDRVGEVLE